VSRLGDLLGVTILLLQLTSWLSLREQFAALRAEFREFKRWIGMPSTRRARALERPAERPAE